MTNRIEFIDHIGNSPLEFAPIPAIEDLPEWFKKMEPYMGGEKIPDYSAPRRNPNGVPKTGTAKRCRPLFDAISQGYLIRLVSDVNVRYRNGEHWFEWPDKEAISFHTPRQIPNYPGQEKRGQDYPKFHHPWGIKTPAGYSTMFLHPIHRDLPFRIMEGTVDTDTYNSPVLLPFSFNDDQFEGLIPAGTPIAQVVPFKRDVWKMEIVPHSSDVEKAWDISNRKLHSLFNDGYKRFFWSRKEYR